MLGIIPFGRPVMGEEERAAVLEVLSGTVLTHGPRVKAFEESFRTFTGAPFALAVSSCTAALHLAYLYLGLGPGDEVIVPAQTHTATAHAVAYTGATPVFADVDPLNGNIDVTHVKTLINEKTRAICVVHFLGTLGPMEALVEICREKNLFLVEDCALALGTFNEEGVHAGLLGDVGAFSFYPVKHITTAEGGMVITRSEEIAETVGRLRAFGIDRNIPAERKRPGIYEVVDLGFNYRLNEIGAAIGEVQMRRLPEFLEKRRANWETLRNALSGVEEIEVLAAEAPVERSSCYALSALLKPEIGKRRDAIVTELKARGVGTSVYYPHPVPLMPYYRERFGYRDSDFPVARRLSDHSITLPVGPHLEPDTMSFIAEELKNALRKT
ncbi:MAG: DegT/DnrJ/EryC1/StrS family aminotransferase [Candidatus Hydrogenedentota bacterium]|nr:MAG: DegT/DnrJ/EryC1/StrS family aminotransferase [Candidatus Hydrogenedentota bacterium]